MTHEEYMTKMRLLNELNRVGCSINGRAAVFVSELVSTRDDDEEFIRGREDQEEADDGCE